MMGCPVRPSGGAFLFDSPVILFSTSGFRLADRMERWGQFEVALV